MIGRILFALALLPVLIVVWLGGVLYLKTLKNPVPAPVVGVPIQETEPPEPYTGPHPSTIERPEENFPFPIRLGQVGPAEPLFAGPRQYPFFCEITRSRLGQPLVDNQDGIGVPVFRDLPGSRWPPRIIGYSKDCLIPSQAHYYYRQTGTGRFLPLEAANGDIEQIRINGRTMDFVVRLEIGVINRYLYAIAVLRGEAETLADPRPDNWNGRLIYQFGGGVGIGYRQGKLRPSHIFSRRAEELAQGYGVVYSTGTRTSYHYNMWLSEDTAMRLKRQFTALYGEPRHTIAIGASGGAVQQYLLAQNRPGLLDGIIPVYSYPDMISQAVYALDCELLEYYFDVVRGTDDFWQRLEHREMVEGLPASDGVDSELSPYFRLARLLRGRWPQKPDGLTACAHDWRGLTPLTANPTYVSRPYFYSERLLGKVRWSHWDDLRQIYGVDDRGYGRRTWDNVGVQYGLEALRNGDLSIRRFLHLNASIGGWKKPERMRGEKLWFFTGHWSPLDLDVWSSENMRIGGGHHPARRTEGDLEAIEAAYRSGHVFLGQIDLPILDVRHYLEKELDMHHSFASLAARGRLMLGRGGADNQVMWVTRKPHDPRGEAVRVMDRWLENLRRYPERGVAGNKPGRAVDSCFDDRGRLMASGEGVWDGPWNQRPPGACHRRYPPSTNSRRIAGQPITDDVLKCRLQSVDSAINRGVYGPVDMSSHQEALTRIFPRGVCDYSKPDAGRPADLLTETVARQ